MKKLLVLALVLVLTFTIAGCSTNAQSGANLDIADVTETVTAIETQPPTQPKTEEVTTAPTQAQTQAKKDENIGEKKAKSIALKHAGLKESEVSGLYVELDYDDGVLRYEVDFRQGQIEYDYDIDAKTGDILSYDKDYDD
ncbi:MAG: PepSY domain-containing protein [Ruminococcus sp.]|nr:PepSY domain-containing protein [Ruminococcus sp.]